MTSFEQINKHGADVIEYMQVNYPGYARCMMQISDFGDPGLAFSLYFPLVMALNADLGSKMMWTVIFSEWANMILKWVTFGDRPFWWVHESALYKNQLPVVVAPPMLMQFPRTCETTPGFPSGHTMLNAAMFFVLAQALCDTVARSTTFLSRTGRTWLIRGIWTTYIIWIALMIISRTYIATHFPHQACAGAAIGLVIAISVSRMTSLQTLSWKKYTLLAACIAGSVLAIFQIYKLYGVDPMWSVEKAIRWCMRREYLRVDTTPFYSLMRNSGTALGLGLGLSTLMYKQADRSKFTSKMSVSLAIITMVTSQTGIFIHQSLSPRMMGWYAAEFLLNAVMSFVVTAVLPHFVRITSRVSAGEKWKKP